MVNLEFKYKHSNAEKTYTDSKGRKRTYKVCDVCGAEQQNNFGFEVSHDRSGCNGSYRLSLCGKCANRLLPHLEDAIKHIQEDVRQLKGLINE